MNYYKFPKTVMEITIKELSENDKFQFLNKTKITILIFNILLLIFMV